MPKANFEELINQLVQESVHDAKGKIPATFCTAWPSAKTILQQIADAVKNVWVKLAIKIVIAIGDGLCPS